MDGTEFYYKRRGMGFTQEELADQLGVAERTVRRWEKNEFEIPDGAAADLDRLHAGFGERVLTTVEMLLEQVEGLDDMYDLPPEDRPVVEIASFNTPESHALAHPDESWAYHKALIAAVGMVLAGEGFRTTFTTVAQEPDA